MAIHSIGRKEAIALGLKRYFTGKPCKNGHTAERLVSNMGCLECAYSSFKRYYHKNAETMSSRVKAYRSTEEFKKNRNQARRCEEYRKARRSEYKANHHRSLLKASEYRSRNPDRFRKASEKWRASNKHIKAASQRARDADKINATPAWIDKEKILEIYKEAKRLEAETGVPHEVDHIYPLRSKILSGLHIPINLRAVPALVNRRKGNKLPEFDREYPVHWKGWKLR